MLRKLSWFKKLSDLDLAVLSLAQCLYVQDLDSFNRMSDIGQKHWIDKYGTEFPKLVDEELNEGKNDKKWIKAIRCGKYYRK